MRCKILKESNDYFISENGYVYNYHTKKRLSRWINNEGYPCSSITINGKSISLRIHRLLAMAFIPNPDNLPVVEHIDDNKLNFNLDNLRWGTQKTNMLQAAIYGNCKGRTDTKSVTIETVKAVKTDLVNNETVRSIAEKYNITLGQVYRIKHNNSSVAKHIDIDTSYLKLKINTIYDIDTVIDIYTLIKNKRYGKSFCALARRFNVPNKLVYDIKNGVYSWDKIEHAIKERQSNAEV